MFTIIDIKLMEVRVVSQNLFQKANSVKMKICITHNTQLTLHICFAWDSFCSKLMVVPGKQVWRE